ncbi:MULTISPECIES: Na+/H+ antiporter NhaC [Pasteurellaceae]|uniref:Na+/H+ antiporter NhaC n=1 Tax=Pasteurella atlantica TaxID=2827233 RepID=A0AAW8CFY4_9PAST|nr:Na+/H+ antiporter NhaC [Pasteurella atlantica]MBR0573147.1 Na+/H+ antiporter NhaC [Pasteurella atlantica]MDP8038996.1 Na+/H+ antiporter NhaC [Pasteurella atlantica]MDP8041086.1 Na+/H+ antiporter NhaC [Pasteurella atlantica]MDP8043301.1 Na+/H+ antiporter NhaC [Pasteurella atlantica]MDP8045387.1 Na+/H+ antiporter NhaC [Pasteurella atlantica]
MNNQTKTPTLLVALSPILVMLFLLGFGYALFNLPAEPLMVISCIFAGILVKYLGFSYQDILSSIAEKIAKTMPALLILITVGLLIGTWIAGGTIPMMIYYGLKIIDPQYIYITALGLTSIVSVCTGTSWGSAGTVGVAFMGVAVGLDANLAATAGAVVAGAYFGDKLSPLSDTTNIASTAAGVDLYEHIAHLLYTTLPSFILAAVVYIIYGMSGDFHSVETPEKVLGMISGLENIYHFNIFFLMIPVIIILWGSITKKPTIPVMLLSATVAVINAIFIQNFALHDVINSAVNGFNVSMIPSDMNVNADLAKLLNRGGMNSMMGTLLICFCALSFAGILSLSGALEVIIQSLLRLVKSTASLIFATILCGLTMIGVTCNGQISILIPGEMLRKAYIDRGLHPKNLSRTAEDSATIIEPILPWTAAGAYMAGTLGIPTLSYLPWAILCWSGIVFAMLWGITGFGIAKLNKN